MNIGCGSREWSSTSFWFWLYSAVPEVSTSALASWKLVLTVFGCWALRTVHLKFQCQYCSLLFFSHIFELRWLFFICSVVLKIVSLFDDTWSFLCTLFIHVIDLIQSSVTWLFYLFGTSIFILAIFSWAIMVLVFVASWMHAPYRWLRSVIRVFLWIKLHI